jgi:hypothetical protein
MDLAPELASLPAWLAAPAERKAAMIDAIAAALGDDWKPIATTEITPERAHYSEWKAADLEDHYAALATPGQPTGAGLVHLPTGVVFRVIPGATFRMGLSGDEEAAIRSAVQGTGDADEAIGYLERQRGWMTPVRDVTIRPFLYAASPAIGNQLVALGLQSGAVDAA